MTMKMQVCYTSVRIWRVRLARLLLYSWVVCLCGAGAGTATGTATANTLAWIHELIVGSNYFIPASIQRNTTEQDRGWASRRTTPRMTELTRGRNPWNTSVLNHENIHGKDHRRPHGNMNGKTHTKSHGRTPARTQEKSREVQVQVLSSRRRLLVTVDSEVVMDLPHSAGAEGTMGLQLLVLSQHTGRLLLSRRFNTTDYTESLGISPIISALSRGRILVFGIKDEAALNLAFSARMLLSEIGLWSTQYLHYRGYLAAVLTMGGATHGDTVVNDADTLTEGFYTSPVVLDVTVPLADEDECVWLIDDNYYKRAAFCNSYDGYGDFCDCENPTPIFWEAIPLEGSVIDDVPLVIIAGNRPIELYRCILTVLRAPGGSRERLLVVVDGVHAEVTQLLELLQVRYNINREFEDGPAPEYLGSRISFHYRYAIQLAFLTFPQAPGILIMEEDLLAAPDFFSFFNQTAWLLEADPSLYCISAWNDLGAMHTSRDATKLMRVETLVGNGWMLSRATYDEVIVRWNKLVGNHDWDVWLRMEEVAGQRECVVPEVSRVFHFGLSGAHVRGVLTQAHFAGHLATARPDITLDGVDTLVQSEYERWLYGQLTAETTLFLNTTLSPCRSSFLPRNYTKGNVVFFFSMSQLQDRSAWSRLAACQGLWQLDTRGHHRGLFRYKFYNTSVMAIGHPFSDYSYLKPPGTHIIRSFSGVEEMDKLGKMTLMNRMRFRVPELEHLVPSLMVQPSTETPVYVAKVHDKLYTLMPT